MTLNRKYQIKIQNIQKENIKSMILFQLTPFSIHGIKATVFSVYSIGVKAIVQFLHLQTFFSKNWKYGMRSVLVPPYTMPLHCVWQRAHEEHGSDKHCH